MAGFLPGGIGYGRPAGLPDPGGVLAPQQGGLFGSYSAPAGGIFSALKDAAAYLGGGGSTDNFAQYNAQNQQAQIRQQLLQGLTSEDPATRQQAYGYANLLGIPTDGFQKQQAAQALPKLLQSMQPSTQTVAPTSAPLPNLPGQSVQGGGFSFQAPGLGVNDALAQSGSPELQSEYAPQILQSAIAQQSKAAEPFTLKDGEHRFVGGVDVANLPEKNNPNQPFNVDGSPNKAYQAYQAQLKTAEQGPAWARLAFDKSKEGNTNFTAPTTVEAADPKNPGQRTQFLAQQDKKSGQWYSGDQTRVPLSDVMLPGGVPGGGRAAAQVGRMIGAAKDVATGLNNVSQLPITASTGLMGLIGGNQEAHSLFDATRTVLANQMTPQEVQSTKAMYVGIAKAIGTLDAGGLQTSDTFLKQIGGLLPADGDTHLTKLLKLAELRQQADNALESQLNGPLLSSQQKVYAKELRASLAKSIPWSPTDVLALTKSSDPNAKISDFASKAGLGGAASPAGWSNFKVHN
jgi:hypothetical protein